MNSSNTISVCAFAGSSAPVEGGFTAAARRLGELMAGRGWQCVHGGGSAGLMGALSDGVFAAGGQVTAVIPKFMVDNGWLDERLPQVIITADMHERKQHMHGLADAFVALPGGVGTLEELLEAITWRQLGLHAKPIVVLDTGGYYHSLDAQLRHALDSQFMRPGHAALWTMATTPEQAVEALEREIAQGPTTVESKL